MTTFRARLRTLIDASKMVDSAASVACGLSIDTIRKIFENPQSSPKLDTVVQLARGLGSTPEWLAFGVGDHKAVESSNIVAIREENAGPISARSVPTEPSIRRVNDTSYIQASSDVLRRYVSGALQNESIPEAQADAYADAVLELIRGRSTAHVVLRLEDTHHTAIGSQAPASADRS